jgi:hypothetical protein
MKPGGALIGRPRELRDIPRIYDRPDLKLNMNFSSKWEPSVLRCVFGFSRRPPPLHPGGRWVTGPSYCGGPFSYVFVSLSDAQD